MTLRLPLRLIPRKRPLALLPPGTRTRLLSSNSRDNLSLLEQVSRGEVTPLEAQRLLTPQLQKSASLEEMTALVEDFARIDHGRDLRTGLPEVIFGEGKSTEQILEIFRVMKRDQSSRGRSVGFATRVPPSVFGELSAALPDLIYYSDARIVALPALEATPTSKDTIPLRVAVLCAGTSDLPVAEEAAVTGELFGLSVDRLYDVGVAGLHRLLQRLPVVRQADVVICVAGMDGALPSVVGGLARCPVIAVPTSVGYGMALGGIAPLLTMLNACAPGVSVVNIDNGFGAASCAAKILDLKRK